MKSDKLERNIIDRSTYDFPKQEGRVQKSKNLPEEELVERLAEAAAEANGAVYAGVVDSGPYAHYARMFLAMMKALQDG